MSRLDQLLTAYRSHIAIPWPEGLAGIQRVIFAVYDKEDELKLRARIDDFAQATQAAGKRWHGIDLTNAFPDWLSTQEYREAYFECPEDLDGYPSGEVTAFAAHLQTGLRDTVTRAGDAETVVAITGVATLFGLARVSALVESLKDAFAGRLLVFFPGEHNPETHAYRLLDARDGWNYLALPLTPDHR